MKRLNINRVIVQYVNIRIITIRTLKHNKYKSFDNVLLNIA